MDKRNYMYEFIEKTSKDINTKVRNRETDAKILDYFKDVYKTIGDGIHVENVEEPIVLDVGEKIESLEKIYNNIDESVKDTFLVGIVQFFNQHNEYYNGKIVEYFRKLLEKRTKVNESVVENKGNEEETKKDNSENALGDNDSIDLTGSDLDGSDTSEDDNDSEDDSENEEEKEEDETKTTVNEVSFEDGPAITAYKKELEELERELAEKKNFNNQEFMSEYNDFSNHQKEMNKELKELKTQYEEVKKRYEAVSKDTSLLLIGEKLEDIEKVMLDLKSKIETTENELKDINSINNIEDFIKSKYNDFSSHREEMNKELIELKTQYEEVKKRYEAVSKDTSLLLIGEKLEDIEKVMLDLKSKIETTENELRDINNINNIEDFIKYTQTKITKEENKNTLNKRDEIEQEIAKLEAEQKDLEEKYNEAVKREQLGMFKQGENATDYKQLLDKNKQQIEILNGELAKLDEEMKSTEESFTKLNQNNDLENNIQNHKDNIKLYYEILEDIKNLYNAIKNGLDLNSEQAKNMINSINERKSKLPESLNNELTNKLNEVLNLNKDNTKKPIPIDKIEDKPKVTWKTFAMLAAGLGLGATIGFLAPTGVVVVTGVALGLLKGYIGKLRGKAEQKRLLGKQTIEKIEEPSSKLQANIQKFKQYIKSEEGLRDISWGLTGGLIGLAGGKIAKGFVNQPQTHTQTPNVQNEPNVVEPNNTSSYSDIKIGNKVNEFNVTQGHDSASWAVNNSNTEQLIGKYVDANSTFQKLGIVGPDGAVKTITTPGTSVQDLINAGVSKDNIAVLVGKNGVGQAWETVSELTGEVIENVTRSL